MVINAANVFALKEASQLFSPGCYIDHPGKENLNKW